MPTFVPEIGLLDDVITFSLVSAGMTTGVILEITIGMTFGKANPNPDGVTSESNYPQPL